MRTIMMAAALALGTASVATPAAAQNVQIPAGLVNVTVGDVILSNILSENEIDVLRNANLLNDNTLQVQVPIGIAANVCNISAAVLAKQSADAAPCTAQSGSKALAQAIRKQHIRNN